MDGVRVTESVDTRILESGTDTRITEQYTVQEGSILLEGTGQVTSSPTQTIQVSSSLQGSLGVLSVGVGVKFGRIELNAVSSVPSVPFDLIKISYSTMSGSGLIQQAQGFNTLQGSASPQSTTTFQGFGQKFFSASSGMSSTSSFEVQCQKFLFGIFTIVEQEDTRITESGDTRITESGDTRITLNIYGNIGEGFIYPSATLTKFNSEVYVKTSSTPAWKIGTPNVKYSSNWVIPTRIYRKTSTYWQRIY